MKLASLKQGGRDGTLVVVDRRVSQATAVPRIATTLQAALDDWDAARPALEDVYGRLNAGGIATSFKLRPDALAAPLPRAYQWLDGSAYVRHVALARRARGAEMPEHLFREPLMYQGASDAPCGPCDPITGLDPAWGIDFEAEVAVITGDVPLGTPAAVAGRHIRLLMLVNDVSLRGLIPEELAKGFGFVHGKPSSAYSPAAVTPDELGDAYHGHRVHLPLRSHVNGQLFGQPNAGVDMTFDFAQLLAHACRTRRLEAGTIVGSGTVSNEDPTTGNSCIVERRMQETLTEGGATTPFLQPGDRVRIEMLDGRGQSVFGAIDQTVA